MWIGAVKLDVVTEDAPYAGTDNLVKATIVRDGQQLLNLKLDWPDEDDLERGAERAYTYFNLPWINDQTPELPDGLGASPMPYPDHGIEFSNGLNGHLRLKLRIGGDDMWIKDDVDAFVRQIRQVATSFDTLAWQEDSEWTHIGTWSKDVAMSTDWTEGVATWTLVLN